jgi:hypothetical protein
MSKPKQPRFPTLLTKTVKRTDTSMIGKQAADTKNAKLQKPTQVGITNLASSEAKVKSLENEGKSIQETTKKLIAQLKSQTIVAKTQADSAAENVKESQATLDLIKSRLPMLKLIQTELNNISEIEGEIKPSKIKNFFDRSRDSANFNYFQNNDWLLNTINEVRSENFSSYSSDYYDLEDFYTISKKYDEDQFYRCLKLVKDKFDECSYLEQLCIVSNVDYNTVSIILENPIDFNNFKQINKIVNSLGNSDILKILELNSQN